MSYDRTVSGVHVISPGCQHILLEVAVPKLLTTYNGVVLVTCYSYDDMYDGEGTLILKGPLVTPVDVPDVMELHMDTPYWLDPLVTTKLPYIDPSGTRWSHKFTK
jgi:hypothetical protein